MNRYSSVFYTDAVFLGVVSALHTAVHKRADWRSAYDSTVFDANAVFLGLLGALHAAVHKRAFLDAGAVSDAKTILLNFSVTPYTVFHKLHFWTLAPCLMQTPPL